MKKEWELDMQARFLNKEKSWASKLDEKDTDSRQLKDQLDKLTKSHEEMK